MITRRTKGGLLLCLSCKLSVQSAKRLAADMGGYVSCAVCAFYAECEGSCPCLLMLFIMPLQLLPVFSIDVSSRNTDSDALEAGNKLFPTQYTNAATSHRTFTDTDQRMHWFLRIGKADNRSNRLLGCFVGLYGRVSGYFDLDITFQYWHQNLPFSLGFLISSHLR